MKHLTIFGALTTLVLASPAYARDGSHYVGVEGGMLFPKDTIIGDGIGAFGLEHKNGYDLDLILGHDFGFIRAEGELSWKYASHDKYFDDSDEVDADGNTDVRSIMINVLGDLGNDQWAFYAGGGVGYAKVRNKIEVSGEDDTFKDAGFAWQGIAGVRFAVNEMIDIGLKYRYFDTRKLDDNDDDFDFTSHSILASFIYNWGGERVAPPPPPPPPYVAPPAAPPPPATQTCPDGSVILATDACPPPPPPPPPPPEPERG